MLRKKSLAAITAFILSSGMGAQSLVAPYGPTSQTTQRALFVKPQDLAPHIGGKKVTAMLANGSWLEGIVQEVTSDTIRMDVKKSASDRIKKGENAIPLTEFLSFRLKKTKGFWGRAALTPVVGLLGAAVGGVVSTRVGGSFNNVGIAMGTGLAMGLVGGYQMGRALDRRNVTIIVAR